MLFGGSWGATLPILYAQRYPEHVCGLILRSIFLGRAQDTSAFLRDDSKAAQNHPEQWSDLKAIVFPDEPNKKRDFQEFIDALHKLASNEDPEVWQLVAATFSRWEALNSCEDPETLAEELEWCASEDGFCMGRIEIHFMKYGFWLTEGQIINNAAKLANLSIHIVQGQEDKVCPPEQADMLFEAIQTAGSTKITIAKTNAGHSASEPENISALVSATNEFASKVLKGEVMVKPSDVAKTNAWGGDKTTVEDAAPTKVVDADATTSIAPTSMSPTK